MPRMRCGNKASRRVGEDRFMDTTAVVFLKDGAIVPKGKHKPSRRRRFAFVGVGFLHSLGHGALRQLVAQIVQTHAFGG